MVDLLRDTPFSTGAEDKLAIIDVFSESSTESINNISIAANTAATIFDSLRNDKDFLSKLKTALSFLKNDKVRNVENILARIVELIGGNYSAVHNMLPADLKRLIALFTEANNSNLIRLGVEGNYRYKLFTDEQDLQFTEVSKLFTDLQDKKTSSQENDPVTLNVVDSTTEVALYTHIVSSFISLDEPQSAIAVMETIEDPIAKLSILKLVLEATLKKGDLETLEYLLVDNVDILRSDDVMVIGTFLANYIIPTGIVLEDYWTIRVRMLVAFNDMNPNWYKSKRGDDDCEDYYIFAVMSNDSTIILSTYTPTVEETREFILKDFSANLAIRKEYVVSEVLDSLEQSYPTLYLR